MKNGQIQDQVIHANELFNNYENHWCPVHLDHENGKTYGKMKKKEFEENIISVFKFHSLLNPNDDHDYDIWFEMETDFSGATVVQNCIFNIPDEHHAMMIERFRAAFGFWEPVDVRTSV